MNKFILVFGSNISCLHGAGSAKFALNNYGATMFKGHRQITGNSYGIATKGIDICFMDLSEVKEEVDYFINEIVKKYPNNFYSVTSIGCGLAGFTKEEIAPLFAEVRGYPNIEFPVDWRMNTIQEAIVNYEETLGRTLGDYDFANLIDNNQILFNNKKIKIKEDYPYVLQIINECGIEVRY